MLLNICDMIHTDVPHNTQRLYTAGFYSVCPCVFGMILWTRFGQHFRNRTDLSKQTQRYFNVLNQLYLLIITIYRTSHCKRMHGTNVKTAVLPRAV